MEVTSGYLIEKIFERKYREYLETFIKERFRKEYPNAKPLPLEQMPGKYRGIDREPLEPWSERLERFRGEDIFVEPSKNEVSAAIFLQELQDSGKSDGEFIFSLNDAIRVFEMISQPIEREIVWVRLMNKNDSPPAKTIVLGYEPVAIFWKHWSGFLGNIGFFRYYITPFMESPDGLRSKTHFDRLNISGLFDTPEGAQDYADTFSSLSEHEQPKYIAEVRALGI
jgi:hypothetical protein